MDRVLIGSGDSMNIYTAGHSPSQASSHSFLGEEIGGGLIQMQTGKKSVKVNR